jgi:hypothetical protein
MSCKVAGCTTPGCPGRDVLRPFAGLDDMFDHMENEDLLAAVNDYVRIRPLFEKLHTKDEERKAYHRRHQETVKMKAKLLEEHLDADELRRIKELAAERAAEREIARGHK